MSAAFIPRVLPTILPARPDWSSFFGRDAPLEVELGFGRPHFLFSRAAERPDRNVVGIEWKKRWVEASHRKIARENTTNVAAIHGNAWLLFGALFDENSVAGITLNFPDPWWKAKHEKRRIINEPFANLIANRLIDDGFVFIQTDVASLLERMLEALEGPLLVNVAGPRRLIPKKPMTAASHREKKCTTTGVPVFRAVLRKPFGPGKGQGRAVDAIM